MYYINKDGHFVEAKQFDAREIAERFSDLIAMKNSGEMVFGLDDKESLIWIDDIMKGDYVIKNPSGKYEIMDKGVFKTIFQKIETSDKKSLCDIWTKRDKLNEEFKEYLRAIACEKTPRLSIDKALDCVPRLIEQLLRIRIKLEAIKARDKEIETVAKGKVDT